MFEAYSILPPNWKEYSCNTGNKIRLFFFVLRLFNQNLMYDIFLSLKTVWKLGHLWLLFRFHICKGFVIFIFFYNFLDVKSIVGNECLHPFGSGNLVAPKILVIFTFYTFPLIASGNGINFLLIFFSNF